jgi:hypothetical protein
MGAGLKTQPCKNVIVTKPHKGRPGPEFGCRAILLLLLSSSSFLVTGFLSSLVLLLLSQW